MQLLSSPRNVTRLVGTGETASELIGRMIRIQLAKS